MNKNAVLSSMAIQLEAHRAEILEANAQDIHQFAGSDQALFDRLKVDDGKVDGMIQAVQIVLEKPDPIGVERYRFQHENGMEVINRTAPFGTVLIIYESRPDVTIEAAAIAFKSGNKILLKGGKEAIHSNRVLVKCWHLALEEHGYPTDWIQYLDYNRERTQEFLKAPDQPLDLIVPRGGEGLIRFVKQHARCPVLVSGRGNNFVFVDTDADLEKAFQIISNGKLSKISACNALDKVLLNRHIPDFESFVQKVLSFLADQGVEVWVEPRLKNLFPTGEVLTDPSIWEEEFLDYKIVFGVVDDYQEAIQKINRWSGGHSASIITTNDQTAKTFMNGVDAAAVYHNASTRFTDGGQFGMGAELAISTDKMHHRGPLGLEQLVTNKWFIYGNGQIR